MQLQYDYGRLVVPPAQQAGHTMIRWPKLRLKHLVRRLSSVHFEHEPAVAFAAFTFKDIWNADLEHKHFDFLWLILHQKLPFGRAMIGNAMPACHFCGEMTATLRPDHAITECPDFAADYLTEVTRWAVDVVQPQTTECVRSKCRVAWDWKLRPVGPFNEFVFMLVLFAKQTLWHEFCSHYYGHNDRKPTAVLISIFVSRFRSRVSKEILIADRASKKRSLCVSSDVLLRDVLLAAQSSPPLKWWQLFNV